MLYVYVAMYFLYIIYGFIQKIIKLSWDSENDINKHEEISVHV